MNILSDARVLLEADKFAVYAFGDGIVFEDASIVGVLHTFSSVVQVIEQWRSVQEKFVRVQAEGLSRAASKAWNLYTVLLTPEEVSNDVAAQLLELEDDFHASRKIARAGVTDSGRLALALAPVLSLQNDLRVGISDAKLRLSTRLASLHPTLAAFVDDQRVENILARLQEQP